MPKVVILVMAVMARTLCRLREFGRIAESQLTELQNMRMLLEEARALARNVAYHRRVSLESTFRQSLDEVDRQI